MKNPKPMIALFAVGLLVVAGVIAFQLSGDDAAGSARRATARTGATAATPAGGDGPVIVRSRNDRVAARRGDGGVAVATGSAPTVREATGASARPGQVYLREASERDESDRSNGWRLGRRRRQVEMLEARAERLNGIVEQMRADGREDLAARQQSVLDRTRTRASDMREELTELQASAEADGTLADAEQGYEDTPLTRTEARARATAPSARE